MAMTDKELRELRSYCAFLLNEYGIEIAPNDPVIPALYVIHKEMQLNSQNNKVIASSIQEVAGKINPTVFSFNNKDAAYHFQVGIAVKYVLIGGLVLMFTLAGIWYWSMARDVEQARIIIETAGNFGELMKRAKKDKEGYYTIDFIAAKGDSIQRFTEFQAVDDKTVRIVIGREAK